MLETVSSWWNKNGFALLFFLSILFFLICWLFNIKPKKGRAGNLKDYVNDIFNKDDKPKQRKPRNPKKAENRCREIVENIFNKPFPSERPDFLRNPETGKNLECDMMNHDLKLCIERNGEQHYKHVSHFHTPEEFNKQLERDKTKAQLLEKNGYTLMVIPYTVHYDTLDTFIPQMISQNPKYKSYVK